MIEQFPELSSMKFASYELFMQFVARSGKLQKYGVILRESFALQTKTPAFMEGVITEKETLDTFHIAANAVGRYEKQRSDAAKIASDKYQTEISRINDEYQKAVAPHMVSDLVKIACLKTENLPLSSIMASEKVVEGLINPSDKDIKDV